MRRSPTTTAALSGAALACFAANSLLCRSALGSGAIDAATFTTVRLASGAAILALLSFLGSSRPVHHGSAAGALALFAYAATFSFAYLRLPAGQGALLLFGAVQLTMMGAGLLRGERPRRREWLGWILAVAGIVALTRPGVTAPDLRGSVLMAAAGASWGLYSLRGRGAGDPLAATARNFLLTLPLAAVLSLASLRSLHATPRGILLAAVSGSIASGLGYSFWYAALGGLTATRAAMVQLAVPLLAAAGALLLLNEALTLRLVAASVLIVGGLALAVLRPGRRA